MEYKVIAIVPIQKEKETVMHVAQEFENIIKKYNSDGWEYIRTESLKTWVSPSGGCFGIGQTPGFYQEKQMIIFKR